MIHFTINVLCVLLICLTIESIARICKHWKL